MHANSRLEIIDRLAALYVEGRVAGIALNFFLFLTGEFL